MLCNLPKESRENTFVSFSGYWHFKGFTSCFHQLLNPVMKLGELLLSGQEGHPGISFLFAWALQAPLTLFGFVVFIFFTFLTSTCYLLLLAFKVPPAFPSHNHKLLSHIISRDVSIQRSKNFGLLPTSRLLSKKKKVKWQVREGGQLSLSITSILNGPVSYNSSQWPE